MFILKPINNTIKLYNLKEHEDYIDNTINYKGQIKLLKKDDKISIDEIALHRNIHEIAIPEIELIELFKTENMVITRNNTILKEFLKQEKLDYQIKQICSQCLHSEKITFFEDNKIYKYNKKKYCKKCAKKFIDYIIYSEGYVDYMNNRYEILLEKYTDLDKIIDILDSNYDPINNEELTLFDTLDVNEDEYEKLSINELNIPDKFKNILIKDKNFLYPVQVKAVENGLLKNENLLIVSQTASGKTLIGELAGITQVLNNKKMIYLSPLVALANQKYMEFKSKYEELGLNIVIKVGQNRIKTEDELYIEPQPVKDADIIVATYEGLDYILRSGNYKDLEELGVVIIDEIHTLEDEERGHRLNGLVNRLITLYPDSQLIALSATVKNAEEIAETFNMKLVEYDKRPVKIERHLINCLNNEKPDIISQICKKQFNEISTKGYHGQSIIFTNSRRKTQLIANQLRKNGIKAEYYHAGLSYAQKLEIEEDYLNQKISTIVTTSALANGVDFPASTVIFESLQMGFDYLTNNEFHQMLGRAGRPSYHDIGKVYLIVNNKETIQGYNEYQIAVELLNSSVDNVNVLYNEMDVYEQVLSDISALTYCNIEQLRLHYNSITTPITFDEAIKELTNKKMIQYNQQDDTYNITEYGRAISKSFIDIYEAENIRLNLNNDTLELVTRLIKVNNAYLSNHLLNKLAAVNFRYPSTRLFSDRNKEIIFTGEFVGLGVNIENKITNLLNDFMDCDCYYMPYCNCFEINISRHIINRRLQGWSPRKISKEFRREYEVLIHSGDIFSYLDRVIMKLEAIKRISETFNVNKTSRKCSELIEKIENGY